MMKFNKLEIELDKNYSTNEHKLQGTIHFRGEQCDWLTFSLDEEWCKRILEVSLPLTGKAINERVEFVMKEVGLNNEVE